jgi:predicted Zn-dependent protease
MTRRGWLAAALLLPAGCVADELRPENRLRMPVVSAEGGPAAVPDVRPVRAPANEEVARRVGRVGSKLIEANESVGLRPRFQVLGVPGAEVFHRGTSEVLVTEGLVRRCGDDEQLAAVLCLELGKMASEREALAAPEVRQPEHLPPIALAVGHEAGGAFGDADGTGRVEAVKHDRDRRRPGQALPPPPPEALARQFLKQAGYKPEALDAARPLLRTAAGNAEVEKQWTAGAATGP